jgi:multiple sugar transport system ATP-binding protein
VVLGIRPENVREPGPAGAGAAAGGAGAGGPAASGDQPGVVAVRARVEFVEPLGHEVIVHGRVGSDLLVAKVAPRRAPALGADIELRIETEALHLFDAASERRIGD